MLSHQRPWLCAMLCLLALAILSGCRPQPRPVQQPTPAPEAPKPAVSAEQSWNAFVADARSKCEANPGCTLDYEKLHEYDGRHFGATVIGYKDSEYFVNLYRFDAENNKWIASPRSTPPDGYEDVDVPATSEQWNVPRTTIERWMDEANDTVREVYSRRQ